MAQRIEPNDLKSANFNGQPVSHETLRPEKRPALHSRDVKEIDVDAKLHRKDMESEDAVGNTFPLVMKGLAESAERGFAVASFRVKCLDRDKAFAKELASQCRNSGFKTQIVGVNKNGKYVRSGSKALAGWVVEIREAKPDERLRPKQRKPLWKNKAEALQIDATLSKPNWVEAIIQANNALVRSVDREEMPAMARIKILGSNTKTEEFAEELRQLYADVGYKATWTAVHAPGKKSVAIAERPILGWVVQIVEP